MEHEHTTKPSEKLPTPALTAFSRQGVAGANHNQGKAGVIRKGHKERQGVTAEERP